MYIRPQIQPWYSGVYTCISGELLSLFRFHSYTYIYIKKLKCICLYLYIYVYLIFGRRKVIRENSYRYTSETIVRVYTKMPVRNQ